MPLAEGTDSRAKHAEVTERIEDLCREQSIIQDVYNQLAAFLHANTLLPFNDAYIDYLQYFIQEERAKQRTDESHSIVVKRLEDIREEFREYIHNFRQTLKNLTREDQLRSSPLTPDDVLDLIQKLYALPINGENIKTQVEGIEAVQKKIVLVKENIVQLPARGTPSRVMQSLTEVIMRRQ